jgi:Asp/Glu/hydantoin racemase
MKRRIVLIHASRASLDPLMSYYPRAAPELEITNLLDDGLMRLFARDAAEAATDRLAGMIGAGRDVHGAELALLCCSAVTRPMLGSLRAGAGIPVLKIDEPMAQAAVRAGGRIGLIVSFPPTLAITRALVEEAAREADAGIGIDAELLPEAVEALLAGDRPTHDRLLLDAAGRLQSRGAEVIVLAQVSMAHLVEPARARTGLAVFSSLETSLVAVRRALGIP